jgi:hypothetical protein
VSRWGKVLVYLAWPRARWWSGAPVRTVAACARQAATANAERPSGAECAPLNSTVEGGALSSR